MATLERAILIASQAHQGQTDHMGMPYILHPFRVMLTTQTPSEMTVAVLHDVVEDTDWTLEDLAKEGFSQEVLLAVDVLTHRDEDSYEQYIEKVRHNSLAVSVKLADLKDNMNITRIKNLQDKDLERMKRYHKAWFELIKDNR